NAILAAAYAEAGRQADALRQGCGREGITPAFRQRRLRLALTQAGIAHEACRRTQQGGSIKPCRLGVLAVYCVARSLDQFSLAFSAMATGCCWNIGTPGFPENT